MFAIGTLLAAAVAPLELNPAGRPIEVITYSG
jgi:hypothetical protein